jgi:hypothetical protein
VQVIEGVEFRFPDPSVLTFMPEVDWRKRLRAAVVRSGRKQSAIARDAGVAPETLIIRIARVLNENVGWLLDERGFSLSGDEEKELRHVVQFLNDTLLSAGSRRDRPEPNAFPGGAADIPRAFVGRGARLAYEAAGDSMIGAGIADRDILFVKPARGTREANGRVVVCRVDGAEYVKVLDMRAGRIRLLSRNDRYPPIEIAETSRFELVGIVVGRTGPLGG